MQYRTDKTGNRLSVLGFGCMRFAQKGRSIDIAETERQIIESHMWPLNISRIPHSREAWIVCVADKCVSLYETVFRR